MNCTISDITAIISVIVTLIYVFFTGGIMKANKESARAAKESAEAASRQLKEFEEQQKESAKIALYNERLKIYCRWVELIENANSEKNKETQTYDIEEKMILKNGTRFLFNKQIADTLNYYIENYDMACTIVREYSPETGFVSEKEAEIYAKFYNALNEINNLLSPYLIIS